MEAVRGNVGIIYDSSVIAKGKAAEWDGEARLYTMGTCFYQKCRTLCDDSGSVKSWRGKWCISQNTSPSAQISDWLRMVESGIGYYDHNAKQLDRDDPVLSQIPDACYTVELTDMEIDWSGLSDAHVDSLFGGEDFLLEFKTGTITLFFSEANYSLDAIRISSVSDSSWLEITMLLHKAEAGPEMDLDGLATGEGNLFEEWNMVTGE